MHHFHVPLNPRASRDDETGMFFATGPIKLYTVAYALSVLSHIYFAQRWCRKLALPRQAGLWLSGCYLFGTAVGARILYDLLHRKFNPANYLHPSYYFSDGLWGGPLAYLFLASLFILVHGTRWRRTLDLMVLSLPMPMVLAKVACLFNGCCFGIPCDWPWCVTFPYGAQAPAGIARHPTQAYEVIVLLFIWVVLITLERPRWSGLLTLWFVALYGVGRSFTEFFRVLNERSPSAGFLSTSQAICLAGAVIAVLLLWIYRPPRTPFKPPLICAAST